MDVQDNFDMCVNAVYTCRNEEECNVDDVTCKIVGDFGRWQLCISFLMALLKLPSAWYQLNIIFMAPPQEFWCKKPDSFSKYSDEMWRNICSPRIEEHQCLIFDPDFLLVAPYTDRAIIPLVTCPKFVYDQSIFTRTMTSEWDLVCSKHWLVHLTQCTMMWGILLGGIIFGILADKYGRRFPLMTAIILESVTSYAASVIPWYWPFLANWFILALASGGVGIISFVICMEVVSGKWRTIIPVIYQLPFGLGNAIMAGLAYWMRDWRKLEFALATLSSFYILYWFWIPESPRWLLATGQTEKAIEVLKKAARQNKKECNANDIKKLLPKSRSQRNKGPGFITFIKSKNMRLKTVMLSLNWYVSLFCIIADYEYKINQALISGITDLILNILSLIESYIISVGHRILFIPIHLYAGEAAGKQFCTGLAFYAFAQYLGSIGSNIFLTVAWTGIISMPGAIICVFVITRMGRKYTLGIFELITALCFLFILLIPKDVFPNDWPRLLFAGIGFAGMAGSVPALYLYSGEMFPTLGRNVGVGGVSMFARIGSMVAPAVVSLNDIKADLPLILLAFTSFAQILLLVPLPETKDCLLPDTLEQAEKITRKGNQRRDRI